MRRSVSSLLDETSMRVGYPWKRSFFFDLTALLPRDFLE